MGGIISSLTAKGLPAVGGPFVWSYLAFSTTLFLWEQYLEVRQLAKNNETEVPGELKGTVDVKVFAESQAYQKDKRIFGFVKDWVGQVWNQGVGLFIVAPLFWHYAASIYPDNEYKTTLLWLFLQQWVDKPISIPISLYSTFVIEDRHGFNKQTLGLFFTDLVKSELLSYFFGGLLIPLLIWIVHWGGDRFYLYLWGAVQLLIFAMMWIYPNFIQPIFNKFEPLKDQDLKKQIEDLAASLNFPLTNLFQIDGSKRSGHSNAYFFGFWKYKRIVLYDTLMEVYKDITVDSATSKLKISTDTGKVVTGEKVMTAAGKEETIEVGWHISKIGETEYDKAKASESFQFDSDGAWKPDTTDGNAEKKVKITFMVKKRPLDDILAILCHELGHWKYGHTLYNLFISSGHIFALFYLFGAVMYSGDLSKEIVRQFGFGDSQAVMVKLTVFSLLYSPTEALLSFLMTMLSRKFEFQADSFAAKMDRSAALQRGLYGIHEENKGDMNPDSWYSWYHFSHPPLVERLRALKALDAAKSDKKEQ